MKAPILFSPRGTPLAGATWDFYEASSLWNRKGDSDVNWTDAARDTAALLPPANWKVLLDASRKLFANFPMLRGAIMDQASLSFPLTAQYAGKDKQWGKLAEDWLWEWRKIAHVRGTTYDSWTASRIRLIARKVDGDIFTVLTETKNGYPKLQFVRAHRVGNRSLENPIKEGPYAGFRCNNGVVIDDYGRPIAYHILGETEDGDQFISANACFPSYRPDYPDQDRGIPELCASIETMHDLKRLHEYEMRAQLIGSMVWASEHNETGTEDESSLAVTRPVTTPTAGTVGAVTTRRMEQGMLLYMKANSGAKLEAFKNDRPSADQQAFWDRVITAAFSGIEWDASFSLALKEPGGAWARTVIEKIRRCIRNNQAVEAKAMRREDGYAISKAIKLGILPKPKDGDWYSWEYQAPARITADSGNEEKAKQENYKLGSLTLRDWEGEKGNWWEETREQKELEAHDLLTRAKNLRAKFPEMTLQECLTLLEQRSPNPVAGQPQQSEPISQ